jgi:vancomycin permeability regulator SanA
MKKKLYQVFWIFVVWFAIHTIAIIADGLSDENGQCDVAVILGNKVNPDGTPSERLKSRLDKGLELYKNSVVRFIVVSGGTGKEGYPEGTVMKQYLIQHGVPGTRIITDDQGVTTEATAENFRKLAGGFNSVVVVSQYYHISRTKSAFRNAGVKNVKGVHCEYFEIRDVYSIFREFFGYYKYLVKNYFR